MPNLCWSFSKINFYFEQCREKIWLIYLKQKNAEQKRIELSMYFDYLPSCISASGPTPIVWSDRFYGGHPLEINFNLKVRLWFWTKLKFQFKVNKLCFTIEKLPAIQTTGNSIWSHIWAPTELSHAGTDGREIVITRFVLVLILGYD